MQLVLFSLLIILHINSIATLSVILLITVTEYLTEVTYDTLKHSSGLFCCGLWLDVKTEFRIPNDRVCS